MGNCISETDSAPRSKSRSTYSSSNHGTSSGWFGGGGDAGGEEDCAVRCHQEDVDEDGGEEAAARERQRREDVLLRAEADDARCGQLIGCRAGNAVVAREDVFREGLASGGGHIMVGGWATAVSRRRGEQPSQ